MEYENASSQNILERVICVGGLLGACANLYVGDQKIAAEFIGELSLMCHQQDLTKFFGEDLVVDIHRFANANK